LLIPSNPWPEGIGYQGVPSRAVVRGYWIISVDICKRIDICTNTERGNCFAIPLQKLKFKIKMKETTV
jgi:hypothetical protein